MLTITWLAAAIYTPLHAVVVFSIISGLAQADPPPYGHKDAHAYDNQRFGAYPVTTYKTTKFKSPRMLLRHWPQSCSDEDDYFYFISPYGKHIDTPVGPMIYDSHGHLVWHREHPMATFGVMVQQYNGEDYLTWWTGDHQVAGHGHGFGSYYMLDNTYMPFQKLGIYNDQPADLHEFHITKDNTILATSYPKKAHDLTDYKIKEGYIWDGCFQEFDIETNQLLFTWRASEHFSTHCSNRDIGTLGTNAEPWDFFHINSIDKDPHGDYLISARQCGVFKIDGRSGKVLWEIGSKNESFKDTTHKGALNFQWQHHARWTEDYKGITLFANKPRHKIHGEKPSRGIKLELDEEKMKIKSVQFFKHPENVAGIVMGSFQKVDNGNYLLGFGWIAAATEFNANGTVVCDMSYSPLRRDMHGNPKSTKSHSYRTFKLRWKATPYYDPAIHLDRKHNNLYVSWNGATEVRKWGLEGSKMPGEWEHIDDVPKAGFETSISVKIGKWQNWRLTAYDKNDAVIRKWVLNPKGAVQVEQFPTDAKEGQKDKQDGEPKEKQEETHKDKHEQKQKEKQKPKEQEQEQEQEIPESLARNVSFVFFGVAAVLLCIAGVIYSDLSITSLLRRRKSGLHTYEKDGDEEDEALLPVFTDQPEKATESDKMLPESDKT